VGYEQPKSSAQRVAKRRAALRAQGLRPRTIWLPDTSTPEFKAAAARACEALDRELEDVELQAWIDAMVEDVLADFPPPEGYD
jgi:hypothetical protein